MEKKNIWPFSFTGRRNSINQVTGSRTSSVPVTLARDNSVTRARSIIVDLMPMTRSLTKKDLARWRSAWQYAINIDTPRRADLYSIYEDCMVDDHLVGAIRNRKLAVLGRPFKIVDAQGAEIPEATKLLQTKWFKKFISLALDSIFYGHSLIEFGDLVMGQEMKFTSVQLVPRRHVCPDFGTILINIMDDPKKGLKYAESFADWAIEVGESDDLGLLNSVAHQCISKRNVLAFWDQFSELFGMPIRVGKTASRDSKDIDLIEKVLAEMGSAAYGVFPEGTEIQIIEATKGDSYKVYDLRIERVNTEMSKAILGQTMTMDNGSSQSQATVHESVAQEIMMADCDFIHDEINDKLIPFLIKHGFPFEGLCFEYDDTYEYSPTEMKDVETMLLQYYEIDPEYFNAKYNIPITGTKAAASPSGPIQFSAPEKKKSSRDLIGVINLLYAPCDHCGGHPVTLASDDLLKESERIIRAVFNNELQSGSIDPDFVKAVAEKLKSGVINGFKKDVAVDFASPDYRMLLSLKKNVFSFSAAKNYKEIVAMNEALVDDTGAVKSFDQFKTDAMQISEVFNKSYLETEYNLAVNASLMASHWADFEANAEAMPLLMYQTVGDDRVRSEHRALDGVKKPVGDAFWNTYYPPNGWNCRCSVNQLPQGHETPSSKIVRPAVPSMFRVNLAKQGLVFPPDHPYYDGVPDDILTKGEDLLK